MKVQDGLYTYEGSDEPAVSGNDGRPKNNVFDGNTISNTDVGVKIKEGDDNTFTSESRESRLAYSRTARCRNLAIGFHLGVVWGVRHC